VENWAYANQNGSPEERVPNEVNEYSNVTCMTPGYDARGNMTSDGAKTYEYDWANRLVAVKDLSGSVIATYRYDALNRLVSKFLENTGQIITYVYDGGQVIAEYKNGQFQRFFVYGLYIDDPIMMEDNAGNRYYYLKDRQYSVTALTDENGNIVETYEYAAFSVCNSLLHLCIRWMVLGMF
jgi:YD repeat-containing protein